MIRVIAMPSLLLVGAGALAQGRANADAALFDADANGDGSITKEEFTKAREALFARLDRNSDGVITADERPERARARRRDAAGMVDTNGDGNVSKEEFLATPPRGFERADTDKNGVIDATELAAAKENAKALAERVRERRAQ